uniref:Uncharacterized protein n=1 Tax=Arundo donax TaxID=35708 RepID=A0A0A8ZRB0_ARUDO
MFTDEIDTIVCVYSSETSVWGNFHQITSTGFIYGGYRHSVCPVGEHNLLAVKWPAYPPV